MKRARDPVIDSKLKEALGAYKRGHVVLIYDEHGPVVLHGPEFPEKIAGPRFLETIAAMQLARGGASVNVPAEYWNNSEWPEIFKAARDKFLLGRTRREEGRSDS